MLSLPFRPRTFFIFFFFTDTPPPEIYTLSLHDALPICFLFVWQFVLSGPLEIASGYIGFSQYFGYLWKGIDRKSTRLNSSHTVISYAVFCLKKKKLA